MTEIIQDYPPNYDKIAATFELSGREIFAYAGKIYNPGKGRITPELIAHEEVHFRQQGRDPDGWWELYLKNPEFRYEMELDAHRAEYRAFCAIHGDRNARARFLQMLARRLSSPMYGKVVDFREAMRAIK